MQPCGAILSHPKAYKYTFNSTNTMIDMPYEDIIEKIKASSSISETELEEKIKTKMDQLSGLISKEGAAYIVANDLGVKLVQTEGTVKIKDIVAGMRSLETAGKVTRKFDVVEFQKEDRSGKVQSMMIADETGSIRLTAWHNNVDMFAEVNEGDIVKVNDPFIKVNQGQKELHLNDRSKLKLNPEGITISGVAAAPQQPQAERKKIRELTENEVAEVFATIVQVYDPRFFPQCPNCRKKAVEKEDGFHCEEHGAVTPQYGYVSNVILDDGSDSLRAVTFGQQMQELYKNTDAEMQQLKDTPEKFEDMKTELLGEQVIFRGRVVRNQMFDRLELRAMKVIRDVSPAEEIKRLQPESVVETEKPSAEPAVSAQTVETEKPTAMEKPAPDPVTVPKKKEDLPSIDDL